MLRLEKGVGFRNCLSDFAKGFSLSTVSTAIVAAMFAFTALMSVYGMAGQSGVPNESVDIYLVGLFVFGGIFGVIMSTYYRKPIAIAGSFTGTAIFMIVAGQYSMMEATAGALASGVILVILSLTGLIKKVAKLLPNPVVMGMTAGCFLSYGLNIVKPLTDQVVLVVIVLVAYLVCKRFLPKLPAVLISIVAGIIYYLIVGYSFPAFTPAVIWPQFLLPAFTGNFPAVFMSLTIPLTVLVLGAENAQAYGVLMDGDFEPPLNAMTFASGLGGIVSGLTGGVNINIAGPMTAMCASEDAGRKEYRWTASAMTGLLWIVVGPFYPSLANFFAGFPTVFVNMICGLAIFTVLIGALQSAFRDPQHGLSAAFAFLVGASGLKLLGISAPFWALVVGAIVYFVFESQPSKPQPSADET